MRRLTRQTVVLHIIVKCGSSTRSLSRILTFHRMTASRFGSFRLKAIALSSAFVPQDWRKIPDPINYVLFVNICKETFSGGERGQLSRLVLTGPG